uniref:Schlafen AlbA-2 domain-containing protein n=1 Tax=Megaviridae environmental sample TaxID=1737588 RepID=A0A5J6VJM3_9VIRU|nr:MAG: hypothetical protein [Megaviridae environmental sample]
MYLGAPRHDETLYEEYKQIPLNFDNHDEDTIDHHVVEFQRGRISQDLINESISTNLERFIPKVVAGFCNSGIDGKLFLGIDDNGNITGIPSNSMIDPHDIQQQVYSVFERNTSTQNKLEDIHIQVECHLLHIDEDYLDPDKADEISSIYFQEKLEFVQRQHEYRETYNEWYNNMYFYKQKITRVINITRFRNELITFIHREIETYTNADEIQPIIDQLESPAYIVINITNERLSDNCDPRDILYWIWRFREFKTKELCRTKPKKPRGKFTIPKMCYLLSMHETFQRKFLENGLNYYLVEITILGSQVPHRDVGFRHNQGYAYRVRVDTENGPISL